MPPIMISGSQHAYFTEVITRRLRSCCELFLRDQNLIADITLSEPGEVALDTMSQSLVGAINEVLAAIIAEDLWDRAGTLIFPHNAGDSVRSDAFLYTIGGGLPISHPVNSLSLLHDPILHQSSIQSSGLAATRLDINPNGGLTAFGTVGPGVHGLGSGDVLMGGRLEVDGLSYFQQTVVIADDRNFLFGSGNDTLMSWRTSQTPDTLVLALAVSSHSLLVCELGDQSTDFGAPNYANPTIRIQSSDATNVDQYRCAQHDQTDSKDIIGTGSEVVEHVNPVELADDASFDLPDATAGFGFFLVGDGEEYAQISWDSSGVVDLISNSANVVNTDTDTFFCIFDNGTQVRVRNRLGSAKKVIFKYNYWTP